MARLGRAGPDLRQLQLGGSWARGQRPGSGLHNPSLAALGTDMLHNCSVFVQTNDDFPLSLLTKLQTHERAGTLHSCPRPMVPSAGFPRLFLPEATTSLILILNRGGAPWPCHKGRLPGVRQNQGLR